MFDITILNAGTKHPYGDNTSSLKKLDWNVKDASFIGCKNDAVYFQVAVNTKETAAISTGNDPMFSYNGDVPQIRVAAEVEGGLDISLSLIGYNVDDDGTEKPDIILNDKSAHMYKNKPQFIWVEINVPKDTEKGIYKGEIKFYEHRMFEDEVLSETLTFTIDVKNVVMPSAGEQKFYLDLWQHASNIARKHEAPYWSDKHFEILEKYIATIAELGQNAITIIATEIPWSGQNCYRMKQYPTDMYEYSMISVVKETDGTFTYDYSNMQRYIDLCMKYGIKDEIEIFGLINIKTCDEWLVTPTEYPDGLRIRYFDKSDGTYKYMLQTSEVKDYIGGLYNYFVEKGLADIVQVVADEPRDVDLHRVRLNLIKEMAPGFKYKTAISHAQFVNEFKSDINDVVPSLECVCSEWDIIKEFQPTHPGRILWYVCCQPQYPNTFIRSPLTESRLIPIMTYFMGLDGFLRWNYTAWPENPRVRMSYRYPLWSAGDTNFVYPSYGGDVLLTIRYKILRQGIKDFELMKMAEERLGADHKIFAEIKNLILKTDNIRDFTEKPPHMLYSLEWEDYDKARAILLDALS